VIAAPSIAMAEPRHSFAIPAGTLGDAAVLVSRQAGVTVGLTDPALARVRTAPVHGRMTVAHVLSRLVAGTPAQAERIDDALWRIARRPAEPDKRPDRPARARVPMEISSPSDIVVTASKRAIGLDRYPGGAYVVAASSLSHAAAGQGTEAIVALIPALASTHLGAGRNKLFIRGVADSSFNGPTPATVGQYFGDVRLNYNAPDPDLSLYDIDAVEILEGPQGTLYGAGALGGILRVVPQPALLDRFDGSIAVGHSFATRAADGGDLVGIVNVPIVTDTLGIRAVAFRTIDGGYIDDAGRGLKDVNRTSKRGGRATLRLRPGDGWTVDLGLLVQNVTTEDGQYAERGLPPLTRISRIAQPFDNDYVLASLSVAKDWGPLHLVSATGLVRHDVSSTYDFSPAGGEPTLFRQANRIRLLTSETRLSRRGTDGTGWVLGLNLMHDDERLTRALGTPDAPLPLLGVDNDVTQAALFGDAGFRLFGNVTAGIGARLEYTRLSGRPIDGGTAEQGGADRKQISLLPSLSLSWQPRHSFIGFIHYQEGFRTGGLSVSGDGHAQRFRGDTLGMVEGGVRFGDPVNGRFDASMTVSYSRWEHIQADLVDGSGLPFTANIGTGRVIGTEGKAAWKPMHGLRIEGAVFVNASDLLHPAPGFATDGMSELPNIAHVGGRFSAGYSRSLASGWELTANAMLRYVGRSRLGVGSTLDFVQGNYLETAAGLGLGKGRYRVSLDAANLFNAVGNRFSLGNPFDVALGRQIVPQRPRTIRLGLEARF
jgi:outer membrane receptor protein involved in Fe transport